MTKEILSNLLVALSKEGADVAVKTAVRNGHKISVGIIFNGICGKEIASKSETGMQMLPTLYAEDYIRDLLAGEFEKVAKKMVATVLNADIAQAKEMQKNAKTFIDSFKAAKKNLILCVAPKVASEIVRSSILDLKLYVRIPVGGGGSIAVTKTLLDYWGIDEEELFAAAMESAMARGYRIIGITEYITSEKWGLGTEPECQSVMEATELKPDMAYKVSNKEGYYGASALVMPGILAKIAELLGITDRLVILPSSIHEILIMKMDPAMPYEYISQMIQDINAEEVEESEVLSSHPYYYNVKTGELSVR